MFASSLKAVPDLALDADASPAALARLPLGAG